MLVFRLESLQMLTKMTKNENLIVAKWVNLAIKAERCYLYIVEICFFSAGNLNAGGSWCLIRLTLGLGCLFF